MHNQLEKRFIQSTLSVRSVEEGGTTARIIEGLAIPFGKPSLPLSDDKEFEFVEYINEAAFDKVLSDAGLEVMLLYSHDWDAPLARRSAKRLEIKKTPEGIAFTAILPDTTRAQDLIKDIEAGNIQGNSFGFFPTRERWFVDENGVNTREILEAELYEISPVVMPAYPDTTLAKRSYDLFRAAAKPATPALNTRSNALKLLQLKLKTKD